MSDQQPPEYSRPTSKADVKAAKAHYKASRPWYKKKRILFPLILLALIVIIVAANSGGGSDPKSPTTASSDTSSSPTDTASSAPTKAAPAAPKALKVRAAKILKDFDSNEAAADAKYKGKHLRITGVVGKVDTELIDDNQYVIQIGGGGDFEIVYVNCDDQTSAVAAKIHKGQQVTVTADFEDGGDLGVEVKNCKLVS
jgi:hypothetical protein